MEATVPLAQEQATDYDYTFLSDDLWMKVFCFLEPDVIAKCATLCRSWRDVARGREVWKSVLSARLGKDIARQLEDRAAAIDWAAAARAFLWCPCKRTEVVRQSPVPAFAVKRRKNKSKWANWPWAKEGPGVFLRKSRGFLLEEPSVGRRLPPCLWERAASFVDAADGHLGQLRGLSPCSSVEEKAAEVSCPGQRAKGASFSASDATLQGHPSWAAPFSGSYQPPASPQWKACEAILGAACRCDARNVTHYRGMLRELPDSFVTAVAQWNDMALGQNPACERLRCPWCSELATCGDNVLRFPDGTGFPDRSNLAVLICSQGHLLIWHTTREPVRLAAFEDDDLVRDFQEWKAWGDDSDIDEFDRRSFGYDSDFDYVWDS